MTWALAEVGRPGPARDVLDGGDVHPASGRLLSVAELHAALRAARAASTRRPSTDLGLAPTRRTTQPANKSTRPEQADTQQRTGTRLAAPARSSAVTSAPAAARVLAEPSDRQGAAGEAPAEPTVLRPPAARRWVAVVGAHGGAGTSTFALALADAAAAAGRPVHLVSCNPPAECGLVGAATVERLAPAADAASRDPADPGHTPAWPAVPRGVDEQDLLTVVDAEAGAARAPQLLATADAVLLVCRVSVLGVQQAEQLLGPLLTGTGATQAGTAHYGAGPVVLVAALGEVGWSGRWPRAARNATGPLLGQLQADSRVVTVPLDRQLAAYRPTGSALPRAVTRSAALAVRLLDGTRTVHRPRSADPDLRPVIAPRTPAHPAPDGLLDDKDTNG